MKKLLFLLAILPAICFGQITLSPPSYTSGTIPGGPYLPLHSKADNALRIDGAGGASVWDQSGTLQLTPGSGNPVQINKNGGSLLVDNIAGYTGANTALNGITLTGTNGSTLNVGTGGTLAASAYTNALNASNISSGTLAIAQGGTGATTAQAARTSLGVAPPYRPNPPSSLRLKNIPKLLTTVGYRINLMVAGDSTANDKILYPMTERFGYAGVGLREAATSFTGTAELRGDSAGALGAGDNPDYTVWPNGQWYDLTSGSTIEFGGSNGDGTVKQIVANYFKVYYIAKSGAGTFLFQTWNSNTSSWTTQQTINADNSSTAVGTVATVDFANGTDTASLYPTKVRLSHSSGGTVQIIGVKLSLKMTTAGTETSGVVANFMALGGLSPTNMDDTADAIVQPILQDISPNLFIIMDKGDGLAGWQTLIEKWMGWLPTCDFAWVSACPYNSTFGGGATEPAQNATDREMGEWMESKGGVWIDLDPAYVDWATMNAQGLMQDDVHLNDAGTTWQAARMFDALFGFANEGLFNWSGGGSLTRRWYLSTQASDTVWRNPFGALTLNLQARSDKDDTNIVFDRPGYASGSALKIINTGNAGNFANGLQMKFDGLYPMFNVNSGGFRLGCYSGTSLSTSTPYYPTGLLSITSASNKVGFTVNMCGTPSVDIMQWSTGASPSTDGTRLGGITKDGDLDLGTRGILGTTTNNNAPSGDVGQSTISTIASGSAISLTTATTANLTSISLTAGDWDVRYDVYFVGSAAVTTQQDSSISQTSATLSTTAGEFISNAFGMTLSGTLTHSKSTIRVSLASTTTIYLPVQATFSGGTMTAYGSLRARRVR